MMRAHRIRCHFATENNTMKSSTVSKVNINAIKAHQRGEKMIHATQERGRITARVSHPIAEKLQEAADLSGATLNQFLVQAALEKAEKIIDRERTIRFTQDDAAMLIQLLDNPARPNVALTKAFERYKNKVTNGELGNVIGSIG